MVIPQWVIGRFVSGLSLVPIIVNTSTGVAALQSSVAMTGLLEEIDLQLTNGTSVIVPLDQRQDNETIFGSSQQLSLTELLSPMPAGGPVLANFSYNFDHGQFTYARAGKAWTMVGVVKSYGENIRRDSGKGPLVLGPAGVTPTYG